MQLQSSFTDNHLPVDGITTTHAVDWLLDCYSDFISYVSYMYIYISFFFFNRSSTVVNFTLHFNK